MTANLTHDTTSITGASTIAELAFCTDASGCWSHDGVALSDAGPDAGPDVETVLVDHPVEELLRASLDGLTDEPVPDDETASVLRDAWRRAQRRTGKNPPEGGDGPVDITDVHHALRSRPASQSRVTDLVVDTGGGTFTFLPITMLPTPRLSWALRLATNEARRAGADAVGIAHLVRGLLSEALPNALASPHR